MKKLLVVLSIVVAINSFSQDYPMPDSGAVWSNEYFQYGGNPPQVYYYNFQYTHYCTHGEDTLINALNYTKIDTCDGGYKGAFRNDSCQVYFVPSGESAEYLLYDFCPTIGDTLYDVYQEWAGGGGYDLVDLVVADFTPDSMLIDGNYRNVVELNWPGITWIEGVGNDAGLFQGSKENVSLFFIDLICHSVDGTKIYPNYQAGGCDLGVSIDQNEFSFNVYPNPVENSLTVEIDNLDGDIKAQIFDIQGKEMLAFNVDQFTKTVDLSDLQSGIYLLSLSNSTSSKVVRIVKL